MVPPTSNERRGEIDVGEDAAPASVAAVVVDKAAFAAVVLLDGADAAAADADAMAAAIAADFRSTFCVRHRRCHRRRPEAWCESDCGGKRSRDGDKGAQVTVRLSTIECRLCKAWEWTNRALPVHESDGEYVKYDERCCRPVRSTGGVEKKRACVLVWTAT